MKITKQYKYFVFNLVASPGNNFRHLFVAVRVCHFYAIPGNVDKNVQQQGEK